MKAKYIVIPLVVFVLLKLVFATIFFLFNPIVVLTLLGLWIMAKSGIFAKCADFFRCPAKPSKPKKAEEVIIEVEPINLD